MRGARGFLAVVGLCLLGAWYTPDGGPATTAAGQPASADKAALSAKLVDEALDHYLFGNYPAAIEKAERAIAAADNAKAWRTIGTASCFLKKMNRAMEAWKHVGPWDRQFIEYVCARRNMEFPEEMRTTPRPTKPVFPQQKFVWHGSARSSNNAKHKASDGSRKGGNPGVGNDEADRHGATVRGQGAHGSMSAQTTASESGRAAGSIAAVQRGAIKRGPAPMPHPPSPSGGKAPARSGEVAPPVTPSESTPDESVELPTRDPQKALLDQAVDEYILGDFREATKKARQALSFGESWRAWRIVAASACSMHNRRGVMAAWPHLVPWNYQFIQFVCEKNHIVVP